MEAEPLTNAELNMLTQVLKNERAGKNNLGDIAHRGLLRALAHAREANALVEALKWCEKWDGLTTCNEGTWELWSRGARLARAKSLPAAVKAVWQRIALAQAAEETHALEEHYAALRERLEGGAS